MHSPGPGERLLVYGEPGDVPLQLLFLNGRPATPLAAGGAIWADAEGLRAVVFDDHGRVARVLQGATEGLPPLTQPMFAAARGGGFVAMETDGSGLYFRDGSAVAWLDAEGPGPTVGDSALALVTARSVLEFGLGPVRSSEPLLWVRRPGDAEPRPVGSVLRPREPFLGQLVNTGWAAVDRASRVYFASAVRPELRAFDRDGAPLWIATWEPDVAIPEPTLTPAGGSLTPRFTIVQHGIVAGPDGRLYVLAAVAPQGKASRLLVFGPDGRLERASDIDGRLALYADRGGHVYALPADRALSRTGAPPRAAFRPFSLPTLDGSGTIDLGAYRGRVVVVNFWASWCGPCRREMPVLDAYARTLDPAEAVVLGLNEDADPADGLRFLEEIGGVSYPVAAGHADLKAIYNYRGLPYTVILDRNLRVVRSIYGFGEDIGPIREVVEREAAGSDDAEPGT
ncbi:MAG: hypothetical protein D6701_03100 [Gemmatimonadetes bacterium]|nr:MAG: hypothetical protein D6701_03100 [Gemmatimonadota bacterium]